MPGSQGSKTRPKMENIAMNSDDKQCRLPLVRRGSAPEVFELLDLRRRNVADANVFALLANCPDILKPFLDMADAVRDGYGLDPVLRELAVIMTCQSLGNRYEQVRHWNIARRLGVPAEKLALIGEFEVSEEFSALEKAVLRLARDATRDPEGVGAEIWSEVHSNLGDQQMLSLLFTIGWYNMSARVTGPACLPIEADLVRL